MTLPQAFRTAGDREFTFDVRDWPRAMVAELEMLATDAGLHVSGDGAHMLIRPWPRHIDGTLHTGAQCDTCPADARLRNFPIAHNSYVC